MPEYYVGNANTDGVERRGWIVGPFMEHGLHATNDVEVKWAYHPEGEERYEWVTGETRTALCMLVSGLYAIKFRDKETILQKPGDYVLWGAGIDHSWKAIQDSTIVTIRWDLPK